MVSRLRIEALEARQVLTGNVVVQFSDDDLRIIGDKFDNELEISQVADEILIQGNSDTTLNGETEPIAIPAEDIEEVSIHLKAGADVINISSVVFGDDVEIDTGKGDDSVAILNSEIGGDVEIETGKGNDSVRVEGTAGEASSNLMSIEGELEIETQQGDDAVTIDSNVGDDTSIETGQGNDRVQLQAFFNNASYDGDVEIDTGQGNDNIRVLEAFGAFSLHIGGDLEITTGQGDDESNIAGSALGAGGSFVVDGDVEIDLGQGNDSLFIGFNVFGSTTINGDLEVETGVGDDQLSVVAGLGSLLVTGDVTLDGGSGTDGPRDGVSTQVLGDDVVILGDTEVKNFEIGV